MCDLSEKHKFDGLVILVNENKIVASVVFFGGKVVRLEVMARECFVVVFPVMRNKFLVEVIFAILE
jgi:hypothetical protein